METDKSLVVIGSSSYLISTETSNTAEDELLYFGRGMEITRHRKNGDLTFKSESTSFSEYVKRNNLVIKTITIYRWEVEKMSSTLFERLNSGEVVSVRYDTVVVNFVVYTGKTGSLVTFVLDEDGNMLSPAGVSLHDYLTQLNREGKMLTGICVFTTNQMGTRSYDTLLQREYARVFS